MIRKNYYPVLEFDDDKDAVVNPFKWNLEPFSSDKLIITFGYVGCSACGVKKIIFCGGDDVSQDEWATLSPKVGSDTALQGKNSPVDCF